MSEPTFLHVLFEHWVDAAGGAGRSADTFVVYGRNAAQRGRPYGLSAAQQRHLPQTLKSASAAQAVEVAEARRRARFGGSAYRFLRERRPHDPLVRALDEYAAEYPNDALNRPLGVIGAAQLEAHDVVLRRRRDDALRAVGVRLVATELPRDAGEARDAAIDADEARGSDGGQHMQRLYPWYREEQERRPVPVPVVVTPGPDGIEHVEHRATLDDGRCGSYGTGPHQTPEPSNDAYHVLPASIAVVPSGEGELGVVAAAQETQGSADATTTKKGDGPLGAAVGVGQGLIADLKLITGTVGAKTSAAILKTSSAADELVGDQKRVAAAVGDDVKSATLKSTAVVGQATSDGIATTKATFVAGARSVDAALEPLASTEGRGAASGGILDSLDNAVHGVVHTTGRVAADSVNAAASATTAAVHGVNTAVADTAYGVTGAMPPLEYAAHGEGVVSSLKRGTRRAVSGVTGPTDKAQALLVYRKAFIDTEGDSESVASIRAAIATLSVEENDTLQTLLPYLKTKAADSRVFGVLPRSASVPTATSLMSRADRLRGYDRWYAYLVEAHAVGKKLPKTKGIAASNDDIQAIRLGYEAPVLLRFVKAGRAASKKAAILEKATAGQCHGGRHDHHRCTHSSLVRVDGAPTTTSKGGCQCGHRHVGQCPPTQAEIDAEAEEGVGECPCGGGAKTRKGAAFGRKREKRIRELEQELADSEALAAILRAQVGDTLALERDIDAAEKQIDELQRQLQVCRRSGSSTRRASCDACGGAKRLPYYAQEEAMLAEVARDPYIAAMAPTFDELSEERREQIRELARSVARGARGTTAAQMAAPPSAAGGGTSAIEKADLLAWRRRY